MLFGPLLIIVQLTEAVCFELHLSLSLFLSLSPPVLWTQRIYFASVSLGFLCCFDFFFFFFHICVSLV